MLVKQFVSGIDLYTYLRKLVLHMFPQVFQWNEAQYKKLMAQAEVMVVREVRELRGDGKLRRWGFLPQVSPPMYVMIYFTV